MAVNIYTVLHIISRNCYNLIPKEGDVVLTTLASHVQLNDTNFRWPYHSCITTMTCIQDIPLLIDNN